MTKMIFRKFLVIVMFTFGFYGSAQVYVNNWIKAPAKADLEKPLVYVDFWATWCAPCISSMPHTRGLEQRFGDKVLFVYISNEPEYKIREFIERKQYNDMYMANETEKQNFTQYNIHAIPDAFILDPGGRIVWRGHPAKLTSGVLKTLIAQYGNRKGNPRRFVKLGQKAEKNTDNYRHARIHGQKIAYTVFEEPVPNSCERKDGKLLCTGSLKYMFARLAGTDELSVDAPEIYGKLVMPDKDPETNRELFKALLKKNHLQIAEKSEKNQIYILRETDTSSWLNRRLYQYAENPGETIFMADDVSLIIDNANPAQMAKILSEQSGILFRYDGRLQNVFDWNLPLGNKDELFKYLKNELNFRIEPATEEQVVYRIYKKN